MDRRESSPAPPLWNAVNTFVKSYIAKRTDVKPATIINWKHTERCLIAYFGADKALSTITPGDAADWERWLLTAKARENRYGEAGADDGLSRNTARKRVSNAKQFFADAVSRDLIRKNPFADLAGAVAGNRSRDYFVTRAEADAVLAKCPDNQWKLLFALSRYGGLRCPSEHLALTWADVDWDAGRLTVHSPKTEHHAGGASRVIPLFPELRPYLEQAWDEAEEGAVHVITRYRDANANLRTTLNKIIKRAGLTAWPKLFHNLRATRETELAESFPMHVVCKWIGNSAKVAAAHYLQVTDEHYADASQQATQNPTQLAADASGVERVKNKRPIVFPAQTRSIPLVNIHSVGDEGLEPPTSTV